MHVHQVAPQATRLKGPLRPVELAEAAVLADVSITLNLLGFLLPLGYALVVLAIIPIAVLAARHRQRAVIACTVAGIMASLLVAGTGMAVNVLGCSLVGGAVGAANRRGWSVGRTVLTVIVGLWPLVSAAALLVLLILGHLRRLVGIQVVNSWRGTSKFLRAVSLDAVARWGTTATHWEIHHWAISVVAGLLLAFVIATWVTARMTRIVSRNVAFATPVPPVLPPSDGDDEIGPVPVVLENATFRYPGAPRPALDGVSVSVDEGEWVAVMGRNGSGKSTLAKLLIGRPVTDGVVTRPGSPGLGRDGGTAVVAQRPETQVLGVRVRDDVVWGLPHGHPIDIAALLDRVGLGGLSDEETTNLSGGQLQRLAVAAALRAIAWLLVADEPTAMVDPEGRDQLVDLLGSLKSSGTSVVHITHRLQEANRADRVVRIDSGHLVDAIPPLAPLPPLVPLAAPPPGAPAPAPASEKSVFRLASVGHVYGRHSPWARRAISGIDLEIRSGESVLIVGRNGSGKSTLAAVLSGLLVPNEGAATMDGVPLDRCLASVGMSFQHSRLQLMRPWVRADVMYASGCSDEDADAALAAVGLPPAVFGDRRVDELSGGEQRRAALAGLVASRPKLLVLDEPFAGLDTAGRLELTAVLAGLRAETGLALVVVSHDTEGTEPFVDRMVRLDKGRLVDAPLVPPPPKIVGPAPRPAPELHLFRVVPGDSPLHRMWAGTKMAALLAVTLLLSFEPRWPTIGAMALLVAVGVAVARIPLGALPRLPRWFWFAVVVGALITGEAGGKPNIHIGSVSIGVGALEDWARIAVLTVVILLAAALVAWTTPLGAVAPAFSRLARPLKRLRLPIDEWAATLGLTFRCLPLLLDEIRTLAAVRRLRAAHRAAQAPKSNQSIGVVDLLTASMVVGLRRAGELADAIDARGGLRGIGDDHARPGRRDAVLALLIGIAIALGAVAARL